MALLICPFMKNRKGQKWVITSVLIRFFLSKHPLKFGHLAGQVNKKINQTFLITILRLNLNVF